MANGKITWSEPVAALVTLDDIPAPTSPPKILLPGTVIEVLELSVGGEGERMVYFAVEEMERQWRTAIAKSVDTQPVIDSAESQSTAAVAGSMVYHLMAKRGSFAEQMRLRCGLLADPVEVSPAFRKTMAIWPMWLDRSLIVPPLRSLEQLPTLAEIDSVAARWQLDRFDTKSVEGVREMTRRSTKVRTFLKSCNEPFHDPYVEKFVAMADAQIPGCIPSYRELVHAYAERLLPALGSDGLAESQLAELGLALAPWRAAVFGYGDIWTSLATGMLDCDALSLVAAEVLSRRGWGVETLTYFREANSSTQGVQIGHVNLRVTPPRHTPAVGTAPAKEKATAKDASTIFDTTGFPMERYERISGVGSSLVKYQARAGPASEAVAEEVQARAWLNKPLR